MSVYHCLVLTRPGGVPQLRALACESEDGVAEAVGLVIREWRDIIGVEVFSDGKSVVEFDAQALESLRSGR